MKALFEEALKYMRCRKQDPKTFCKQYVQEDNLCGECPYYVSDPVGQEAEEKVLDYVLELYAKGQFNELILEER